MYSANVPMNSVNIPRRFGNNPVHTLRVFWMHSANIPVHTLGLFQDT